MTNRTRIAAYRTDGGGGLPAKDWTAERKRDIRDAFRELGEVIYFMRCADGAIKIGWTANLFVRRRRHSIDLNDLLALMPGTLEDEIALHAEFQPYLRRGLEYYDPAPAIMDRINKLRASMGVPEIA